jgi:CarD family transcriptional regulator
MLKKGDSVVHPNHGAGVLKEIQTWRVSGIERQYHCIELVSGRGTLLIPIDHVEEAGLLPVPSDAAPIIAVLSDKPEALPDDYQKRKLDVAARVHSGDTALLAGVLRDLTWRDREKKLSDGDSQLKAEAQELLAGVLSLQLDLDLDAASHRLSVTLQQAIEARQAAQE